SLICLCSFGLSDFQPQPPAVVLPARCPCLQCCRFLVSSLFYQRHVTEETFQRVI
ncbi:hypothetical protein NDU88_004878, partial [Pleurodeles waltl]